jgi:hypothetical protein
LQHAAAGVPDPGQVLQHAAAGVPDPTQMSRAWGGAAGLPGLPDPLHAIGGAGSIGQSGLPTPPPVPAADLGPLADRVRQLPPPPSFGDLIANEPRLLSGISGFFTWPPTPLP